jgi:hypothetical protein
MVRMSRRGLFDDRPRSRAEKDGMGWWEIRQGGDFAVVTLCFSEGGGVKQMQVGNKQLEIDRPIELLESAIRPGREVPVMCGV